MVLNVQIILTNVLGWSCLIYDSQYILKKKHVYKLKETFCDLQ